MSDDNEDQLLFGDTNNNQNEQEDNVLGEGEIDNDDNNNNNNNDDDDDSSSDDSDDDNDDDAAEQEQQQENGGEEDGQDNNNDFNQQNNNETNSDDIPLMTMSKKEAKKKLSKKEYKKWKKAQKKLKKKNKKDKKGKKGESGKAGKKNKDSSSKKKKHGDDGGNNNNNNYFPMAETSDGAAAPTRRGKNKAATSGGAASSKKPQISVEELRKEANDVVMAMTDARRKDDAARKSGQPPLYRLAIKNMVASAARKVALHEHLVNAGILDELTGWLADAKSNDLAPVDLRLVALYILDNLAFEGIDGGMRISSKQKVRRDPLTGETFVEEDIGYAGVTAEMLQATKLGWAVNFIRRHPNASAENRTTATRLLEKFSRVFRGEEEGGRKNGANGKQLWSSQSDNTILPPFEVMPSVTQRFIEASTKADPNDPISYLRVRRAYNQPSFVTGLGGDAAAKAMAGPRDAATLQQLANNRANGRKTNNRNVDALGRKIKNNKASLESDDDGSLLGSDDDNGSDLGDFLAA